MTPPHLRIVRVLITAASITACAARSRRRPMNIGVQYYYNVERPDGGPGQQLRFVIALLYPTGK